MPVKVGKHFELGEFHSKDGVKVPRRAYGELEHLVQTLLDPIRARFGTTWITSGYRSAAHNAWIHGAAQSFHLYVQDPGRGVAADFVCRHGTPADWAEVLEELGAGGIGTYGNFVHADTRHVRARWLG